MARYGSPAIRGHGIPEAMEQVLSNESRIKPRLIFLKPISAAIAIGTGGPFGAEGPIIATGGALGSVAGQLMRITADERKTLLAAGAAAGMAATFGSPVSAVLLAIELLLFEYRARSLVPVSLAAATATGVRMAFSGSAPVFPMPNLGQPSGSALVTYIVIGAIIGILSVFVTRAVYAVEDGFEKIPVHWMWWPAIGAVAVGVIGWIAPRTLGVGYDNIEKIIAGNIVGSALLVLVVLKFISWAIALGSGTSGGTLAPLFTIGGGLGSAIGAVIIAVAPSLGVDIRIAALVGMAAIFAGASRALLASVVFAFETTRQPMGLLPLLAGCSAAYLASLLLMRNTIMTEKLARSRRCATGSPRASPAPRTRASR
jgi:H+/Cl- antiporter ClcA